MTQDLNSRLDRLERENRRMKRLSLAVLSGAGLLSLMSFVGPAVCKTVWAERFVLKDASNQSRVTFDAYGVEQPRITFHDARGKAMGSLAITDEGSFALQVVEDGRHVPARLTLGETGQLKLARAAVNAGQQSQGKGRSTGVN